MLVKYLLGLYYTFLIISIAYSVISGSRRRFDGHYAGTAERHPDSDRKRTVNNIENFEDLVLCYDKLQTHKS